MRMRKNNYVRLGQHPDAHYVFFDSHNVRDVVRVRAWVAERSVSRSIIAMWAPCKGLDYPLVGDVRHGTWATGN